MEPLTKSSEYFFGQGPWAVIAFFLGLTLAYMYRELKSERKQHTQDIIDLVGKHDIELAGERKLNAELQENRHTELKNALEAVTKVTGTVQQALIILQGRSS
jgi:hypothetical protein